MSARKMFNTIVIQSNDSTNPNDIFSSMCKVSKKEVTQFFFEIMHS
jgi:hypothetical protein